MIRHSQRHGVIQYLVLKASYCDRGNVMRKPGHTRLVALVAMGFMVVSLLGCPFPLQIEDIYGYNTVVLRNMGDRVITGLFIDDPTVPGRGRDYIETEEGLLPGRAFIADGLLNGTYTLEVEYYLTAQETGGAAQLVVETLPSVALYWGETFTWYWYGPAS